ncbi:uncharacterized protein LOC129747772 [Uranotaenia lowii]|uniref:uncharacterized protein LOC129747772 n=1 Tax=Uranotaenia lowii TaxID=190385 RepID=UPI002478C9CD|nr:uncharacterized protein LOC129747772 [Uranotaenia lowii]
MPGCEYVTIVRVDGKKQLCASDSDSGAASELYGSCQSSDEPPASASVPGKLFPKTARIGTMCLRRSWQLVVAVLAILLAAKECSSYSTNEFAGLTDREIVDVLVRRWAPLVWLAPNEKFLPGSVSTFLEHVHAEKAKIVTVYPGNEISDVSELNQYPQYYDLENELTYYDPTVRQAGNRNKRNFRDPSTSLDLLFDLPIGNESKNWYLVTNNDVEELITDKGSFIHGQNPQTENVPIYAVVSTCRSMSDSHNDASSQSSSNSPPSKSGQQQQQTSDGQMMAAAPPGMVDPSTATTAPGPASSTVPIQPPTTNPPIIPQQPVVIHHFGGNHIENGRPTETSCEPVNTSQRPF